ncbi:hypothetical protein [Alicyclobacillus herbarius]|uniref:hypothetical protein n=1 Tax=Alicyclobacillus herbarius TaxID=122960 RepID=UPI0003F9C8CC|nr:hypothetical protein [Alicyclobacillus herbarius]
MGDAKSEEWYSNKDLFEFFNALQREFDGLKAEMQQTREVIRRYNGLREELEKVKATYKPCKMKHVGEAQSGGPSVSGEGGGLLFCRSWQRISKSFMEVDMHGGSGCVGRC